MLYNADTLEEFKNYAPKPGFILTSWCGNPECENHVKEQFGLKSRCIPLDDQISDKLCTICGKPGNTNYIMENNIKINILEIFIL